MFLFTFSYPYAIEKVVFSGPIFLSEFPLKLHILKSSESENQVFNDWSKNLLQHNSQINNNRKLKFCVLNLYYREILLETFYSHLSYNKCMDKQKNSVTFRSVGIISRNSTLIPLVKVNTVKSTNMFQIYKGTTL